MPSYTNIGAYIGSGTIARHLGDGRLVRADRQARVHLSGGVGIGGVLEPPNAKPVVIEDDAFIGSRSIVVEGARSAAGGKTRHRRRSSELEHARGRRDDRRRVEHPRGEIPARAVAVPSHQG